MASNKAKAEKKQETKQSTLEKYEIIEIRRDQIQNADYNPRSITAKAKRHLKNNIKTVGLLGPIIWNRRTGNIVAGHQRIDCMDQLERTHDYMIRVAAVDLDEKTEKEQNVFMNNPEVQGVFDEKLTILLEDPDLNFENMGFSEADVYNVLGENLPGDQVAEMAKLSNTMHKAIDDFNRAAKTSNDRNDTEFYLVVVFKNKESRGEFCKRHGFEDFRYLSGTELDEALSRGTGQ